MYKNIRYIYAKKKNKISFNSQNIWTILFDWKLFSNVYFQKIYSLCVFLLVLVRILEIMDNNSGGAKFTVGSVYVMLVEHFHIKMK
jgi:hypothetical protein